MTADGEEEGILVVESPGFKTLEQLLPRGRKNLLLVTLAPVSGAVGSSARPVTPAERGTLYATSCEPQVRGSSFSLH